MSFEASNSCLGFRVQAPLWVYTPALLTYAALGVRGSGPGAQHLKCRAHHNTFRGAQEFEPGRVLNPEVAFGAGSGGRSGSDPSSMHRHPDE